MPVGFNSPARNLFLLGSTGSQVVGNFFKTIDKSAGTDGVYAPDEIAYNVIDQKYFLAGTASDSNSRTFGWFEKRDEAGTADFEYGLQSSIPTENTTLRAMELDVNNNLVVAGIAGNVPWIAKSDNNGAIQWFATTNTADVRYLGLASDSSGNYYACGRTSLTASDTQAFVEKFDGNGNPGWGKQGYMLGRDVVLKSIDVNDRGEAVAVGYLEDDSNYKGYIIKINANTGDVMWDRTLSADDTILCTDCYIDTKDQIYVTVTGATDSYLVKYTPEGNMQWQRKTAQTGASISYKQVSSDGETGQTITFGTYDDGNDVVGLLSKYSRNGDLVFRRKLQSSFNNSDTFSSLSLYSDPSFYYLLYVDSPVSGLNGTPDKYTYGKVSSSGNGLGAFQYTEGTGVTIDYEILAEPDEIGRLSDGSVRNDTSDLIAYPFGANNILFDDLSTQVTNKKRQMDGPGSFQYSGSPAIRVADFQEINLLGDVYSGSGDWLDQSGNGNDGTTSFTTTVEEPFPGAGSVEFDGTSGTNLTISGTGSILGTNDFTIEFFIYSDSTADRRVFSLGVNNQAGSFVLIKDASGIRMNYGVNTSSSGNLTVVGGGWHHVAVVRNSNNVRIYIDGVLDKDHGTVSDNLNATTLYIGDDPTLNNYELIGLISNLRVVQSALYTANFTPPTTSLTAIAGTQLLTCQGGTIADASTNNLTITANGNAAAAVSTTSGPTHNAAGYWEFNTTGSSPKFEGDYIEVDYDTNLIATGFSLEFWFNGITTGSQAAQFIATQGFMGGGSDNDSTWRIERSNSQTGTIEFSVNNGSGFGQNELISTNFPDGTWHHCVCTFNNGTSTIYKNGVQDVQSTSYTGTPTHPAVDHVLRIGARYDNAPYAFNGSIGEFRIYPRALTPAQVQQNFNASQFKYTNVRPNTTPFFTSNPIVINNNLLLNYDFGSGACIQKSSNIAPGSQEIIVDDAVDNGAAFGDQECVAVGYGKVVVGARGEDNGSYVNGGKAYVYNATTGALEVTLTPSNIAGNDMLFGNAVDIDDTTGRIAVTTPSSIYLYDADGSNEVVIDSTTTLPISPPGGLSFGTSVAISSGRVWTADDNVPTGPTYNGTVYCFDAETGAFIYQLRPKYELDNFYNYGHFLAAGEGKLAVGSGSITHSVTGRAVTGKVYLYDVDGSNEKVIEPLNLTTSSQFGEMSDLDIGYGMIVIGAARQQRTEDPQKIGSGEVFVFDTEGNFKFSIRPSDDPADEDADGMGFGGSVAISSDRIAVGARYYVGNAGGVAGRAYLFDHTGKELQAWIPPTVPIGDASDFGSAMDAAGGTLAIGAAGGSPDLSGRVYIYPVTGTASGKVLNLSNPNVHTATFDAETAGQSPEFKTGNGGFLAFGNKESIRFGSLNDLGFPTGSQSHTITLECWVQARAGVNVNQIFAGIQTPTTQRLYLASHQNKWDFGWGDYSWTVGFTGGTSATDRADTVQNTWTHYCLSINSGVAKLYINSAFTIEKTDTAVDLETGDFPIGGFFEPSETYNANNSKQNYIGEFRIYDSALSTAQVSQNYNATRARYGV